MKIINKIIPGIMVLLSFNLSAQNAAGPHILVYKTRSDYKDLVPITLSSDKSRVTYFPDPIDLQAGGASLLPVALKKGYLMDRRGISPDVAFLKLTYNEYASLSAPPSVGEMLSMVADSDPLAVLCDCGPRYSFKNPEVEINQWIKENKLFEKCKVLKQKPKKHKKNLPTTVH